MEISDAVAQNMFGFIAAIIGGVACGAFSLKATSMAIREENDKENRREEKEVQNLLDALGVEIGALWGFHMRRVGGMVETMKDGTALEFYYPLTQDYFTVYNSNASKIGCIKDASLREAIVVCYNKCKKVVDGFKYNNELFTDWRNFANMCDGSAPDQQRLNAKFKALVDYAVLIKEDHYELKAYVEKMLEMLNSRGQSA